MTLIVSKHAEGRMAERGVVLSDFEESVLEHCKSPLLVGPFTIIKSVRGGSLKIGVTRGPKEVVVKTVVWNKRPKR